MTEPRPEPPASPAARANRADQVAALLASRIMRGELAPGSRLSEVELAASVAVSRNTLREAIKVLVARGLVRQHRHHSAEVARLTPEEVLDLYRLRRLVELAAIDGSRGRPPEAFHELGAAIARLTDASLREGPAIIEADLDFHRAIVRLHQSPRIEQAYLACLDQLTLALTLIDGRTAPLVGLVSDHRELYQLLLDGDIDGCRERLADHLAGSERRLLAAIGSEPPKR